MHRSFLKVRLNARILRTIGPLLYLAPDQLRYGFNVNEILGIVAALRLQAQQGS